MGTRSLTHIKDENGRKTLLTLYRQMDGYPTGMGKDLKDILAPLQLVNGYSGDRPQANGMGCAAAQIVAGLKDGVGSVYIYPTNSKDCWEEYTYTIRAAGETFRLTVQCGGDKIYDGLIADFDPEKVENDENEE